MIDLERPTLTGPMETALLSIFRQEGMLVSGIPEKSHKDLWGDHQPGMGVYEKLIKLGLAFVTEEEPFQLEDGQLFEFTPSIYLTWRGRLEARLRSGHDIDPNVLRKEIHHDDEAETDLGRAVLAQIENGDSPEP